MKSIQLGILLSWDSANSSPFPCSSPSAAAEGWHVDCSPSALLGQTGRSSSSLGGPGAPLPPSPGCPGALFILTRVPTGQAGPAEPSSAASLQHWGGCTSWQGLQAAGCRSQPAPGAPPARSRATPPVQVPLSPAASPCSQHHSAPSCSIWLWVKAFTGWVGSGHRAAPRDPRGGWWLLLAPPVQAQPSPVPGLGWHPQPAHHNPAPAGHRSPPLLYGYKYHNSV